jgi:hypothetical protein
MAKKPKVSKFSGKVRDNAQKTKQTGASFGYLNLPKGISMFSPEPGGKCHLDFMPYVVSSPKHPDGIEPGEIWYKRPFKAHRNIGVEKDSVICLTSIGKKCPICEYRTQMIKEGRDKVETDALKPSARNLYVVIPKKNKKLEEKPHLFDISQAMFQNLLAEELEENESNEVFPDLEQGYTLKIRWDSKTIGGSKPFAEASRIDFEDRDDPYSEDIMEDIPDLDAVLNIMTYQALEKKFLEMEDEEDGSEGEHEAPKQEKRKAKAPEPVDDEEDEEPPAPKKKRKSDPIPDPDEDEQDDVCIACKGTGKNSKGDECKICQGSGEKPQPVQQKPLKTGSKTEKSGKKCSFGHVFGTDCEKFDSCDDCDDWDICIEAKDKG